MNSSKKFAVLLATWNGERFISEQLQSLQAQTVDHIDLWISDDGSSDQTLNLIQEFSKEWTKGKLEVLHHDRSNSKDVENSEYGSNENFRSLILNKNIDADYYSFCDQDDVWDRDKLERAAGWLENQGDDLPNLYCSRTRIIDKYGNVTGKAPLFSRPPNFKNAIVQNIAAGNTIVMNAQAMKLVRASARSANFTSHDWWCYMVVSAHGGSVKYDEIPSLSYRQHDANLIGENSSWKARMTRLRQVLEGRFKRWNDANRNALNSIEADLPLQTRQLLVDYDRARSRTGLPALVALRKTGVHRQTRFGQLSLYFAAVIGKI
ncbi:MAG: glycosyltransferase family 2 protein [Rhizobiaceae bacterium]|nr:glycosyltransferase family 2 protein [Rhizobiaceae bacterium]